MRSPKNFDSREIITPIFQLFLRVIIETPYTGYSKMRLTMKSSTFARSNAEFPKSPTNSQPKKTCSKSTSTHKGRLWSPIGSNQHLHAIVEVPFAVVPAVNPIHSPDRKSIQSSNFTNSFGDDLGVCFTDCRSQNLFKQVLLLRKTMKNDDIIHVSSNFWDFKIFRHTLEGLEKKHHKLCMKRS